jgi:hypothetical protein
MLHEQRMKLLASTIEQLRKEAARLAELNGQD